MKKLILLLVIMVGALLVEAQDKFTVPEFGIKVRDYSEIQKEGAVLDTVNVNVFHMAEVYRYNGNCYFMYDVYRFKNDSTMVNVTRNKRVEIPLNITVNNQTVLEWLQQRNTAGDTTIIEQLSFRAAKYYSVGEAVGE